MGEDGSIAVSVAIVGVCSVAIVGVCSVAIVEEGRRTRPEMEVFAGSECG